MPEGLNGKVRCLGSPGQLRDMAILPVLVSCLMP